MQNFFIIGINHKYAPVATRETLSFSKDKLPAALFDLSKISILSESVILSTCNRVEIYGCSQDLSAAREEVLLFLSRQHQVQREILDEVTYYYQGNEALRHLFRVTAGLDSMVVGEHEILGQVKDAFQLASAAGNIRSLQHQLFQRAFRCAKKVRQETKIGEGAVSVSAVAIELAKKIFGRLTQENILIVGTGKMGEQTLRRLVKIGSRSIWVTSRTAENAEEVARKYSIQAVPYASWKDYLNEADIIICSTAATEPILTKEDVRGVMTARKNKPLFLIDIAVPRDIEGAIAELDDVYLYNVDDLGRLCEANLHFRRAEVVRCTAIVEGQVEQMLQWLRNLDAKPTIQRLQAYFDDMIAEELDRLKNSATAQEIETVRHSFERMRGRLMHDALTRLKENQSDGGGYHYHEVLQTIFGLDRDRKDDDEHTDKKSRNKNQQSGVISSP